jgi:gamma-glutamyltranspeptidase/glutathione hydrolase
MWRSSMGTAMLVRLSRVFTTGSDRGSSCRGRGITLHNLGAAFVLEDGHSNSPAPGKRPYHTIIPAMLGRAGEFLACLGVVGTFMQPQGQLQVLRNLLDRDMDPQRAVTAPRWRWLEGRQVGFEPSFDARVVGALQGRGHKAFELKRFDAGGAQLIVRDGSRLLGGSDPRKDGCALGL